ncbi:MAG: hypothetical protein IPI41_12120 [Flavobacteriales bacterium]|nr:hypothetical protein [Flavobacteriales bacterium]
MTNPTYLGNAAFPPASGYTNASGLGIQRTPLRSNVVHVGNTSVQTDQTVSFGTYSDARFQEHRRGCARRTSSSSSAGHLQRTAHQLAALERGHGKGQHGRHRTSQAGGTSRWS